MAVTPQQVLDRLLPLGRPDEVLPAMLLLAAMQAKANGASAEDYLAAVARFAYEAWGEGMDPKALARAIARLVEDEGKRGEPLSDRERTLVSALKGN